MTTEEDRDHPDYWPTLKLKSMGFEPTRELLDLVGSTYFDAKTAAMRDQREWTASAVDVAKIACHLMPEKYLERDLAEIVPRVILTANLLVATAIESIKAARKRP